MRLHFRRGGPSSLDVAAGDLIKLRSGQRVLLYYHGSDTVWHERLLLWPASADQSTWVVLTPDTKIFAECLQGGDMATHLRVLGADGARPRLWHQVYSFAAPLSSVDLQQWIRQGRDAALDESVFVAARGDEFI